MNGLLVRNLLDKLNGRLVSWAGVPRITAICAVAFAWGLAGCSVVGIAPGAVVPVTGSRPAQSAQVAEYMLVEQSSDNPTHVSFMDRAQAAVVSQRSNWKLPGPSDALKAANQSLTPFGCRLSENSIAPFSAYAFYCGENLIQNNIAKFWPVSTNQKGDGMLEDFLLPVETLDGDRLVVSSVGVGPWPGFDKTHNATPPVYFGSQIAYADTNGEEVDVYAGDTLLFTGPSSATSHNFFSWSDPSSGKDHWALELENNIVLDGLDLNSKHGYDQTFGFQVIDGQPLFFYTRDGLTRISYAGHVLPFTYDQVVHGQQGDLAIFNPSGVEYMAWFYGMRDGLWYYVEIGLRE